MSALDARINGDLKTQHNGAAAPLTDEPAAVDPYVPFSIPDGWQLISAQGARKSGVDGPDVEGIIRHEGDAIFAASETDEHGLIAEALRTVRVPHAARRLTRARAEVQVLESTMVAFAQESVRLGYLRWATSGLRSRRLPHWLVHALTPLLVLLETVAAAIALKRLDPLLPPADAFALTLGAGLSMVLISKSVGEITDRRQRAERAATLEETHPLRIAAPSLCRRMPLDLGFVLMVAFVGILCWGLALFGAARGGGLFLAVGALTAAGSGYLAVASTNEVADLFEGEERSHRRLGRRMNRQARRARALRSVLVDLAGGGQVVEVTGEKRLARRSVAHIERSLRRTKLPVNATPDVPLGTGLETDTGRLDLDGVEAVTVLLRDGARLIDGSSTTRVERAAEQEERRQQVRYARALAGPPEDKGDGPDEEQA